MSFGTAPATDNVASFNGKVEIHTSDVPNAPEPGTILDPTGQVIKGQGWMARLSDKAAESAGVSKGFVALVGIVPASIMLVLTIILMLVNYGRTDQSQIEKLTKIAEATERMEKQFGDLDNRLRQQELQSAKIDGYKLGQTDAGATGHKKEK